MDAESDRNPPTSPNRGRHGPRDLYLKNTLLAPSTNGPAATGGIRMEATIERPNWLSTEAWPWRVRAVATPAGRIAFTDTGSGPTLLLVHIGFWSSVWRELILELATDFRVVAFRYSGGWPQRASAVA
jgi:hypothetical protein